VVAEDEGVEDEGEESEQELRVTPTKKRKVNVKKEGSKRSGPSKKKRKSGKKKKKKKQPVTADDFEEKARLHAIKVWGDRASAEESEDAVTLLGNKFSVKANGAQFTPTTGVCPRSCYAMAGCGRRPREAIEGRWDRHEPDPGYLALGKS